MTTVRIKTGLRKIVIAVAMTLGAAGCARLSSGTMLTPATTAQAGAPRIRDCGLVSVGSPSKYVCDGKVYTSVQLAKMRADSIAKYESGMTEAKANGYGK